MEGAPHPYRTAWSPPPPASPSPKRRVGRALLCVVIVGSAARLAVAIGYQQHAGAQVAVARLLLTIGLTVLVLLRHGRDAKQRGRRARQENPS